VRDEFDKLNRQLRESLIDSDDARGEVLDALFAGVDLIADSDAGRTFAAFWRLLTDPEQSSTLEGSLSDVMSRPFSRSLQPRERRFLLRLTAVLLDEGGSVHDVLQHFARSLKRFVQSREYLEQRRLHSLLRDAQRAALEARDAGRPTRPLDLWLTLTSSQLRSVSQWVMYDPALRLDSPGMHDAAPAEIGLDVVGELVRQSEIDFRTLRQHIRAMLAQCSQTSIAQLLQAFPAEQGLGSVVGYVALGARHGQLSDETEIVAWQGADGSERRARVPMIYFLRERYAELAE
jgi:hypothetical protein